MMQHLQMTRRTMLFSLVGMLMTTMLTLWGCGGSSSTGSGNYTDPTASITTTKTATALIEPATLKQWMDEGKVNNTDPASLDRVVIVTVASAAQYAAQHIPGSTLLDSGTELNMTRLEGVGSIGTMVMTGSTIDNIISRSGINKNTTIVFVASKDQNALNPARAYFTFRYWGFPKERLKVLNGGENGWATAATAGNWAASYALTKTAPTVTASTFSVKNLYTGSTSNFAVRTSIGEMLSVVDKVNTGNLSTTTATGISILDERGGNPTVAIKNAGVDDYAQYAMSGTGNTSTYKALSDITARLATFGVTASKSMNYIYCASGVRASSLYFVLDGVLGWPVSLYDGSWNQWSAYASTATANKVATAWQTDVVTTGTTLNRSSGAISPAGTGVVLDPTSSAMYSSILDPRANQILNEDKAYFTSGSSTTTPSTGGGGSASGC
jgi:3-mercaptopyruvate sulfurtransferase SseA